MITKNPMQLKAFIKKKAEQSNSSAQLVMQNYMLERLLERISQSKYRSNFILKGGFLISAMVGLDTRSTMDLDTTIKGIPLEKAVLQDVFQEICSVEIADDITFEIVSFSEIREKDDYAGIRVGLVGKYLPLAVPLSVDVTTGDKITPGAVEYKFKLLFDDRTIGIMAYNLETILAEKIETILSRNIANTRPRDFYDVYILYELRRDTLDLQMLKIALEGTCEKRGSRFVLFEHQQILDHIKQSTTLNGFWVRYQKEFSYAKEIKFMEVCSCIEGMMKYIFQEGNR